MFLVDKQIRYVDKKIDMFIKTYTHELNFYVSQFKTVVNPLLLETNHAHCNVEDSTYSYSVLRIVQKLGQ